MRAAARAWLLSTCVAALGAPGARDALAQTTTYATPPPRQLHLSPMAPPAPPAKSLESETDLRARFGIELAARLVRSEDADERLEGIERATDVASTEAIGLLVRALESGGAARQDARAMVAVARGLSPHTTQAEARTALQNIVNSAPTTSFAKGSARPMQEAPDAVLELGRLELARATAALALAASPDAHARDMAFAVARGAGTGQALAASAILAAPFAQASTFGSLGLLTPPLIRLLASLGDLRALDPIRNAARSGDSPTRTAALLALADMGDTRALEPARAAAKDVDPQLRAAAARALVLLGAPEGPRAVEALIADDATALAGAHLAETVAEDGVVKALAARVVTSSDLELRRALVAALGRSRGRAAIEVLARLATDPVLEGDAAVAIARSPSDAAGPALLALLAAPEGTKTRRLGARAIVVRAIVRGERDVRAREALGRMAASRDGADRAAARAALVALGEREPGPALADPDPRVRRAVALAAQAVGRSDVARVLLARLAHETDPVARLVLSAGLVDGDPEGHLTTVALLDRAEAGGPDAPLAAMAFSLRAQKAREGKVDALLLSSDPVIRAHAAMGLGKSLAKDGSGRLASAYAYEPDAGARRALVLALASRTQDEAAPDRRASLQLAASLDPDRGVRAIASRALAGLPGPAAPPPIQEVAWLRLETTEGNPLATRDTGVQPAPPTAALIRPDGLAIPIAFDEDGYAVVVVPPGDVRLVLAPRLPAYEASPR